MIKWLTCITAVLVGFTNAAHAWDPLGLRHTSDTVRGLPASMGRAMLEVMQEAEASYMRVLTSTADKFNEVVVRTTDQVARTMNCAAVATARNALDQIDLGRILIGTPRATVRAFRDFDEALAKERFQFSASTDSRKVVIAYSDLLAEAAFLACQMKVGIYSDTETELQTRRIAVSTFEWQFVIGEDRDRPLCPTVHQCVVKRRKEVIEYVKSADSRDLATTNALAMLEQVKPTPANDRSSTFKVIDYETVLIELRKIELAILAAELKRLEAAKRAFNAAKQAITDADTVIYHHRLAICVGRNRTGSAVDALNGGVGRARGNAERAKPLLLEAATTHESYAGALNEQAQALVTRALKNANVLEEMAKEVLRRPMAPPQPAGCA